MSFEYVDNMKTKLQVTLSVWQQRRCVENQRAAEGLNYTNVMSRTNILEEDLLCS